jgi:hypothetical protein
LTTSIIPYLNQINIRFEINNSVVNLLDYNYALCYIDIKNEQNEKDLVNLRTQIKELNQKHLVIIWWDFWLNKPQIIKSKINHLLGLSTKIHARKTVLKPIDKDQALEFQINNHLMTPLPGYKRFGLFLNNQLIAVAVFAKKRKFRDNSYSAELLRFSTLNNIHINGGLSKLIKAFTLQHPIDSLMTYADLDWSDGRKFEKIGFEIIDQQPPMFFKLNNSIRTLSSSQQFDVFNLGSLKLLLIIN